MFSICRIAGTHCDPAIGYVEIQDKSSKVVTSSNATRNQARQIRRNRITQRQHREQKQGSREYAERHSMQRYEITNDSVKKKSQSNRRFDDDNKDKVVEGLHEHEKAPQRHAVASIGRHINEGDNVEKVVRGYGMILLKIPSSQCETSLIVFYWLLGLGTRKRGRVIFDKTKTLQRKDRIKVGPDSK